MCGIVGYFGKGTKEILEQMAGALRYRGPDDLGYLVKEEVGLGHRRLSIIDLTPAAHQPMCNEEKNIWLVFNGEIYNFQDFQMDLEAKGHKFISDSDTEVIIHLYEEYGEGFFSKLNGMFALALWDSRQQRLLLARDRFGQKPLYYFFNGQTLVFASEIKALLLHPAVKRDLDELAIFQYFSFDYVPQPRTIFKNIKKLENSQLLVCKRDKIELKNYYKIELAEKKICEKEALSNLDKLLQDSVSRHLISDVPIGVFLSGGLDSSTIVYYAKKAKEKVKTFSIGFDEKTFDETGYAQAAASYLKTEHYHKQFNSRELIEVIPKVFHKLDEPFADPSILPTFLLSEFAREQVTVALSGDGGDELLCGYPNHRVQKILSRRPLYHLKLGRKLIDYILKLLPVSGENMSRSFILQRALLSGQFDALHRDFIVIGGFNNQLGDLFNFKFSEEELFEFVDDFLSSYSQKNYFQKASLLFQKYYLSDDILFKSDRASMYNSLEMRAPFLDTTLSHFINSLPRHYKIYRQQTKYILKKLMKDKLPTEIVYRKKKGFGVPMAQWLKKDLRGYLIDVLSKENIEKAEILNYQAVRAMIKQHVNGEADHRKILWSLIVFQNWYHQNL